MNKESYHAYLKSKAWKELRRKVWLRSRRWCERCDNSMSAHVHHLTYERIGHERLEDLQAVCENCHEFLHGISKLDPLTCSIDELRIQGGKRYRKQVGIREPEERMPF